MRTFNANARYDSARDVRDHSDLLALSRVPPPNGVLYPLVAARRAGKTWTLLALESLCTKNAVSSQYVDLRRGDLPPPETLKCQSLLLDEPELSDDAQNARDPKVFLDWCRQIHEQRITILLAMSPAEWMALEKAGERFAMVSPRDLQFLPSLDDAQAEKVARTPEAKLLLGRLQPNWKKNPFLLELVFQIAEENDFDSKLNTWDLLRRVRERSADPEFRYFDAVFHNGLTSDQRSALRQVAHAERVNEVDINPLTRCGIVKTVGSRPTIIDPILEANLLPLRIHHVSDLHFGPKSAKRVDVKAKGAHADRLASGLGSNSVAHDFLGHLEQLKQDGQAPHLLVISGDVAEWAKESEFAEAKQWIEQAQKHLGEHPRLPPDAAHVLLVGGNHDVDWGQTEGSSGPRKRHLPFAQAFNGMERLVRINLEESPETRQLTVARYADLGIELLLLGSAEFGGEDEKDPVRQQLFELMMRLRKDALDAKDQEQLQALGKRRDKIDPGLVHHDELERVRRYPWLLPIRIAVLHHPVSPLPTTELGHYVGLINAGEVKDRLMGSGFCLVLHGHAHTGCFFKEQWPGKHRERSLHIASAPSLGSDEIQESNGFNEIVIVRDDKENGPPYSISVRRYAREGATWRAKDDKMKFDVPGV